MIGVNGPESWLNAMRYNKKSRRSKNIEDRRGEMHLYMDMHPADKIPKRNKGIVEVEDYNPDTSVKKDLKKKLKNRQF